MRRLILVLAVVAGTLSPLVAGPQDRREQGTHAEMRASLGELFERKKYAEAAAMLERVLARFPDDVRSTVASSSALAV